MEEYDEFPSFASPALCMDMSPSSSSSSSSSSYFGAAGLGGGGGAAGGETVFSLLNGTLNVEGFVRPEALPTRIPRDFGGPGLDDKENLGGCEGVKFPVMPSLREEVWEGAGSEVWEGV